VSTASATRVGEDRWPDKVDPRTICLTCDVEWAAPAILDDIRKLMDERGLRGTFFCTHANIDAGAHERALHPNFRRDGDTLSSMDATEGNDGRRNDAAVFRHVIATTRGFAPEAKGVRAHSLHYDSLLIPLYREFGLEYDSSYQIPLVDGLRPFWKENELLEIPIFFNDFFELKTGAVDFDVDRLKLDRPGIKVMNFHPNLAFINAASGAQYVASKPHYRDVERLRGLRHRGRGVRTLLLELLDRIATSGLPTATLGELNARWRGAN
jgi:peptidoglycan/xylan/chitin deacetylase (PgdA/CDA1 family)